MVLQRAPQRASIWGYAPDNDIGGTVSITVYSILIPRMTVTTSVQPGGVWQALLPALNFTTTTPCIIETTLSNYAPLVLSDVLFGDVWVCSGQSNMKFSVSAIFNASQIAAEVPMYAPFIRIFSVGQVESKTPLPDIQSIEIGWSRPTPGSIRPFSAVCWLYGRNIFIKRGVPMGLVESAWGGTNIEAWSSPDCLRACRLDPSKTTDINNNVPPQRLTLELVNSAVGERPSYQLVPDPSANTGNSLLWNAMINPLLNMTIFGVIWNQGEANTNYNRDLYNCTFPSMITDWRQKWFLGSMEQTDLTFPFGFIQIGPTDGKPVIAGYADVRWHSTVDTGFAPNRFLNKVFMGVSFDLTDRDVHFRDKTTAAWRLSLSGLAVAYNYVDVKYQGPWVTQVTAGAKHLKLTYDHDKSIIALRNTIGFEVCCNSSGCEMSGSDWVAAPIIAESSTNTTVTLDIEQCTSLKLLSGLRYGWCETPFPYLKAAVYSVENDLPAPPFIFSFSPPSL